MLVQHGSTGAHRVTMGWHCALPVAQRQKAQSFTEGARPQLAELTMKQRGLDIMAMLPLLIVVSPKVNRSLIWLCHL